MRLYIVDDDPLARRLVRRMLAGSAAECEEFGTAADFLGALDTLPFGCVLLDVQMPGHDGLEILAHVQSRRPLPVIMASGSVDMDDAITAFRRGAVHFLRKPFTLSALQAALDEAEAAGLARMATTQRQERASRIRLTPRELQVLETMASGQQSKLAAWRLGLSVRTVEMHRSNVLTKLGATNASQAAALARELQLLPAGEATA